ncbi:hypothetical protein GCM10011533_14470 [Streptosporangium jomthongense]|nr:hypothetical protein GCM10011533_14470 [Streptosporangium jomthongense]
MPIVNANTPNQTLFFEMKCLRAEDPSVKSRTKAQTVIGIEIINPTQRSRFEISPETTILTG